MAQFALYHYELSAFEHKEPRLFPLGNTAIEYKTMENLFESLLPARGASLDVKEVKVVGKGEEATTTYETHGSKVLQNRNHIIAFKVQKNGRKKVMTVDWDKEDVPHHPVVRVLIDNRPDRQLMAIENRSDFKAEKAFELMADHFNLHLKDHYVRFDCFPLLKKAGFWESVDEIKKRFKDFVKRVQFDFVGKERTGKLFSDQLASFVNLINGAHGGFFVNFKNDDQLERAKADIEHMAQLCYMNKDYNLSVKFRDFGTFCYGQDIKAQWGLDDEKIDEFSKKYTQTDMYASGDKAFNEIADWFDKINELFADYIRTGETEYYSLDGYALIADKAAEIMGLLHYHTDEKDKPQKYLMPLAAAVEAGCMAKPTLDDFNHEFKKKATPTSYNRYVKEHNGGERPYQGMPAYDSLLKEFRAIKH